MTFLNELSFFDKGVLQQIVTDNAKRCICLSYEDDRIRHVTEILPLQYIITWLQEFKSAQGVFLSNIYLRIIPMIFLFSLGFVKNNFCFAIFKGISLQS